MSKRLKVLIVSGGSDSERKISLISAKAVKEALTKASFQVFVYDLIKGYKELEKMLSSYDVVFPVIHGEEGEGGNLQKFLSKHAVKFVGGDWRGFKRGWYKIPFKRFCQKYAVPTPKWKLVKEKKDIVAFGLPAVLKASNGGSSREVEVIKTVGDLDSNKSKKILASDAALFVEEFLAGIEVTVGVLGKRSLPIVEIIPPRGHWFDYPYKYTPQTQEIVGAPSVSAKVREKTEQLALKIHQLLNGGAYSRTDFIIYQDIAYAIDFNTIPGLTPESLFPKEARAAGISYEALIKKLVRDSLGHPKLS